MRELNWIVQTSLDGFVAGPKGEFDKFIGGEENLGFVCDITESADAALFGRISYQLLESDWPTAADKPGATKNMITYSNWYNSVAKIILSKTLSTNSSKNIQVINDHLSTEINKIKQRNGKDILIFGSPTAVHELLRLNVIDHAWLIVHPVIFAEGIPLFSKRNPLINCKLLSSQKLTNGTLCNKYALQKI